MKTTQPPVSYGSGFKAPPVVTSTPTNGSSTTGIFIVTVRDLDKRVRSDIPIHYAGYKKGTVYTGANGVARVVLPEGTYRIDVPAGCAKRVIVKRGTGGSLGLVAGTTVRVPFQTVAMRRFDATNPVTWTPEAPWPVGAKVRFRFSLTDVCVNKLAPKTSLADRRYVPSGEIELLDTTQTTSDGEAYVTITFRCKRAGPAKIWFQSRDDPTDRTDLLALRPPPFDPTADRCRAA